MERLRVGTFNVQHCRGVDEVVDIARTAETIARLEVDVIALQEVDAGRDRSGGEDQAAALAELTGLEIEFHPTLAGYGIAVAGSNLTEVTFEQLPRAGNEEPRGVIVATVGGLRLLAAHLSRHRRARWLQLDRLADLAGSVAGPVVVAGDLNTSRRGLGALAAEGFDLGPEIYTWPAIKPLRQIDHLLASGGARITQRAAVASDASDHLPLVGTVEWDRSEPASC